MLALAKRVAIRQDLQTQLVAILVLEVSVHGLLTLRAGGFLIQDTLLSPPINQITYYSLVIGGYKKIPETMLFLLQYPMISVHTYSLYFVRVICQAYLDTQGGSFEAGTQGLDELFYFWAQIQGAHYFYMKLVPMPSLPDT